MLDLYTSQGENLTGTPWDIYPRPQLRRNSYVNLNGKWEFTVSQSSELPQEYPQEILLPFCPESLLSGLKQTIAPGSYLFYRRKLPLPSEFQQGRILLHIGAADQIADIYVNQQQVGTHKGGYYSFTVDITDALTQSNELVIRCLDDLRDVRLPYGKQTLKQGGMWYTPVSGIWQTVWLECVPEVYIQDLDIRVTTSSATITVSPAMNGVCLCQGREYPIKNGQAVITPEHPHLWSPEDPYLYEFSVITPTDRVESYFALRTIETKTVRGIPRLCLNGKPYFFHGLLDQGYWPDGIYTPASPDCYTRDILAMKALGFNTLRKHIKIEAEEFYYQCDKLGMIVFQDMVNNGTYRFFRDTALPTACIQKLPDHRMHKEGREEFLTAMKDTVHQLKNHPCILYWTIFNEGWGQFDADNVYEQFLRLDDTRIVDATSGWFRQKKSDVDSRHIYFGPWGQLKPSRKPLVLSEFGGFTCAVEGHLFNPEKSYGYKTCTNLQDFQSQIDLLYRKRILPAIKKGLCAAIITQVSDVEDEINGFLTYDRKVSKADTATMKRLADDLRQAIDEVDA